MFLFISNRYTNISFLFLFFFYTKYPEPIYMLITYLQGYIKFGDCPDNIQGKRVKPFILLNALMRQFKVEIFFGIRR